MYNNIKLETIVDWWGVWREEVSTLLICNKKKTKKQSIEKATYDNGMRHILVYSSHAATEERRKNGYALSQKEYWKNNVG